MENIDIPAQDILCGFQDYEKFLLQEDIHRKEGNNSAIIQKELPPNTCNKKKKHKDD